MARRPPLYGRHEQRGATVTEFGGWEMPVEFDSIRTEHAAVRESVGVFDVSHMGEIEVSGPDAVGLTQRLTTNDVAALDPGEAHYAAVTDGAGIMLDDTVVYRLPADRGGELLFVPNAGHDGEMCDRWRAHRDEWGLEASVTNATTDYAMFAIQGPEAPDVVLETVADAGRIGDLPRFGIAGATVAGVDCLVARTGYTGEAGFEVLVPWSEAGPVWSAFGCQPCGLGARDTLRIEMGFLLSGQDFDPEEEPRTPYEAGIGFAVDLGTEFVGRDALERVAADGVDEALVGFELVDRGVPRHGYEVTDTDGQPIGHVTSGTMSPTLEEPIGTAYLPVAYDEPGRAVRVLVRGEPKKAQTRALPFVDR